MVVASVVGSSVKVYPGGRNWEISTVFITGPGSSLSSDALKPGGRKEEGSTVWTTGMILVVDSVVGSGV